MTSSRPTHSNRRLTFRAKTVRKNGPTLKSSKKCTTIRPVTMIKIPLICFSKTLRKELISLKKILKLILKVNYKSISRLPISKTCKNRLIKRRQIK